MPRHLLQPAPNMLSFLLLLTLAVPAYSAPPTLSTPTVTSVTATSAILGATVDTDGGTPPVTERGTVWAPGPATNPTANPLAEGTGLGAFSHNRTGLPPGSLIIFRGYGVNADGTGYSADGSFYTEPSQQADGVTIDPVPADGYYNLTVHWNVPADADGVLTVIRQSLPNTAYPADGTEYSANARIGLGDTLDPSCLFYCDWVVYKGAGTSVNITGLKAGNTYYVAVYAYAGAGTGASGINYVHARSGLNTDSATTATYNLSHNELYVGLANDDCKNCHGAHHTPGLLPRNLDQFNKCFACHRIGGAAAGKNNIGLHLADGSVDCGSCHSLHSFRTEELYSTNHAGTSLHNLSFVRSNMKKYINTTDFGKDALEPTVFQTRPGDFVYDNITDTPPYNAACQTCHTTTIHHTQTGTGSNQNHQSSADCVVCHPHNTGSPYSAFGIRGCTTCHASVQDDGVGSPRRAVVGEFSLAGHHVQGGTVTDSDCLVCHYEGFDATRHRDRKIDLRNPDTGAVITISNTYFTRDTTTNVLETWVTDVQNNFCLKCHDSDGATATYINNPPYLVRSPKQPFSAGAGDVLNVFDQLDPGNTFYHAVRAANDHPYCTPTTANGNFVTMEPPWNQNPGDHDLISCFDCHGTSGHGSVNQRMLRTAIDFAAIEAATSRSDLSTSDGADVETFCSLCHKATVYVTEKDPETVGSNFERHGDGKNDHRAAGGNQLGCMACHAAPVDLGELGVSNGAGRGMIHGGNFTWPDVSPTVNGAVTEFFLLGGPLRGWETYEKNVPADRGRCWAQTCHGSENYNRNPIP